MRAAGSWAAAEAEESQVPPGALGSAPRQLHPMLVSHWDRALMLQGGARVPLGLSPCASLTIPVQCLVLVFPCPPIPTTLPGLEPASLPGACPTEPPGTAGVLQALGCCWPVRHRCRHPSLGRLARSYNPVLLIWPQCSARGGAVAGGTRAGMGGGTGGADITSRRGSEGWGG